MCVNCSLHFDSQRELHEKTVMRDIHREAKSWILGSEMRVLNSTQHKHEQLNIFETCQDAYFIYTQVDTIFVSRSPCCY